MRRTVRTGLFETNSSSTHTIVVARGDREIPEYMTKNPVKVTGGEFGWEIEQYHLPEDKLSYLYTAITYLDKPSYSPSLEDVEEALASVGVTVEWVKLDDDYYPAGYIDHASGLRDFLQYLQSSSENILDFIFGKDSAVSTGNDNDGDPVDVSPTGVDYVEFYKGN